MSLPSNLDSDYYTAYSTPNGKNDPQRIVGGKGGENYYTKDHYKTFNKIVDKFKNYFGGSKKKT